MARFCGANGGALMLKAIGSAIEKFCSFVGWQVFLPTVCIADLFRVGRNAAHPNYCR